MPIVVPVRRFWTLRSGSALLRVLAFALVLFVLMLGSRFLYGSLALPGLMMPATARELGLIAILNLFPFLAAYWLLVRVVEARRIEELAARKLLPHAIAGFLAGTVLFTVVAGLLWIAGSYRVEGMDPAAPWVRGLLWAGILPAVSEEIISRGVVFRLVEQRWGSWIALIVSALIFGFLHAWNPNATVWSCAAIAIEAGLLFGIVYTITRSLYFCMGLHAAWNFMEGPVLGTPISGIRLHGLFTSTLRGPAWLGGGPFGIEASVLTVALMVGVSGALIVHAQRRGLMRPPRRRDVCMPTLPTTSAVALSATSE